MSSIRHTLRAAAAAVAVAALSMLAAGAEPSDALPPGPYRRGCTGCAVDAAEGLLRCNSCRDGLGTVLCSEIGLGGCPSFMNNDGVLECTRSLLDNEDSDGAALPAGPYLAECGGCALYGDDDGSDNDGNGAAGGVVLECTECPDRRGVFHIARLALDRAAPCAEVLNADGRLFCHATYRAGMERDVPFDPAVDNNADEGRALDAEAVAAIEAELQRHYAARTHHGEQQEEEHGEATCM